MKRALVILAALVTVTATAQDKAVDALNKKLEKANASIAKKASAATLIDRAGIYVNLADVYTNKIIPGVSIDQFISTAGQPESVEEVVYSGEHLEKYSFANVDIYANSENKEIQFWLAKTVVDPQALDKAYQDLMQAKQINAKEFTTSGIMVVGNLANQYQTAGMAYYTLTQRGKAAEMFEKAAQASTLIDKADTVMLYYAGVSYLDAENYEKAAELLKEAADNGYEEGGNTYFFISAIEKNRGNTDAAIAILKENIDKFPTNDNMLGQLINLMLESEESDLGETLALIKKAEAIDPANSSFYLTEASIHDQMGNDAAAEEALVKAYELDSTNFMTVYNIGIIRARKGDAFINEAKKLDVNDIEAYNVLLEKAAPYYDGAIEMLEKAHELDPMDARIAQVLRTLYYNKRDDSPGMEARYNYYDELYKELQK